MGHPKTANTLMDLWGTPKPPTSPRTCGAPRNHQLLHGPVGHPETTNGSRPFGMPRNCREPPQIPQGPPSCGAPPWVALPAGAPRFLPAPRSRCPPPTAAAPKGPQDMWGLPLARLATALCALLATRLTAQDPSVATTKDHQVATATFTASAPVATEDQQLATTGALPETSPRASQRPKSHLGDLVATTEDHQDPVAGSRPALKSSGGHHEGPEATSSHHHAVMEATLWMTTVATTGGHQPMVEPTVDRQVVGDLTSHQPPLEATSGHRQEVLATTEAQMTSWVPMGHQPTLEATTSHDLIVETTSEDQRTSLVFTSQQPTLVATGGHQPSWKTTVGYQSPSKTTVGHKSPWKPTQGHQPPRKTTVGYHPTPVATVGHQPTLEATAGHHPTPTTTKLLMAHPGVTPAPQSSSWRWLLVAAVVAMLAATMLLAWWHCHRRRHSGSTSFGPWAGPALVAEDDGGGGTATVTQPLVATVATVQQEPTLSTFRATSGSMAMEELPGPKGEEAPANGDPGAQATPPT